MKGLKIKIQALLLCGVLITGLFSSCASDENIDNGNKVNAGDKVLTLTLNTPKATTTSGAKTRADGTNITGNPTEDKINRLTIGIFSSDGSTGTVRTIQDLSLGTGTGQYDTSSKKATLVTNSLAAGDIVLVAANAPAGTFNGCKTAPEFKAKSIAIDVALATPSTGPVSPAVVEATDNIPMYGDASTSDAGTGVIAAPQSPATTYTAAVKIQHQLAKITLNTLGVAFKSDGPYANATFKPTSFFLINVPDNLNFNAAAWNGSSATWQGWDNTTDPGKASYKAYLGTGPITYTAMKVGGTASITPGNIFYTMPNSDVNKNTKLVIGGDFSSDGSNTTTTVYYPVNINWVYDTDSKTSGPADGGKGGPTAKAVYPNKNYICKVYIKTKGATSPTDQIDPEAVSVEVTVTPFVDADQDTTFE